MKLSAWLVAIILFGLALAVRLTGLGGFITADEPKWIDRSRWFVVGLLYPQQECPPVEYGRAEAASGLACTLQIGYPGVTTMWAGGLGLLGHYWQVVAPTGVDLQTFLTGLSVYRTDPAVIAPARWPLAFLGALFVPAFYLLLRRLFSAPVALIAALLVALHPYQIALARVIHHDSFNTVFMTLALLTLLGYWHRGWSWRWLVVSGVMGGLALLSKQVSWFLPPFMGLLAGLTWLYTLQQPGRWPRLGRLLLDGLVWGAIAAAVFVALFPAMWVMPGETLWTIYEASTRLVEEGHPHFFWGQVSEDPGPWFYPTGWILQATLPEMAGLVGLLGLGVAAAARPKSAGQWLKAHPTEVSLGVYVALLLFFVTWSDKKMVRYFLPAFPVIDIFLAWGLIGGLVGVVHWLSGLTGQSPGAPVAGRETLAQPGQSGTTGLASKLMLPVALGIVIGQGWAVSQNYPYYFTYYNPLVGGLSGAAQIMTIIGWGEGLDQAGRFLDEQPQASTLTVVVERACSMLRPFFSGQVNCLNSTTGGLLKGDYYVYYVNVTQRGLLWPKQWSYFDQHQAPAFRLRLGGIDYVLVYRNPIEHQVDRELNYVPAAIRALGYSLSAQGDLTLIWQNEGLGQESLWLGLAPTNGVFPAGQAVPPESRWWLKCPPKPGFEPELSSTGTIVESVCPLAALDLWPGLFDVQLGLGDEENLRPLENSRLGVVQIGSDRTYRPVTLTPLSPGERTLFR